VENPLARALLRGEFRPGATIRVDGDPVGGTLLFTQEGTTVVADTADRRDARSGEDAAAGGGRSGAARGRASLLDLPPTAPLTKDGDERLN
jgi:hypothetical protein